MVPFTKTSERAGWIQKKEGGGIKFYPVIYKAQGGRSGLWAERAGIKKKAAKRRAPRRARPGARQRGGDRRREGQAAGEDSKRPGRKKSLPDDRRQGRKNFYQGNKRPRPPAGAKRAASGRAGAPGRRRVIPRSVQRFLSPRGCGDDRCNRWGRRRSRPPPPGPWLHGQRRRIGRPDGGRPHA